MTDAVHIKVLGFRTIRITTNETNAFWCAIEAENDLEESFWDDNHWQLGRDLVKKKAEERWGSGVVEQVNLDLQKEFPNENGFSVRNLWYMKKWFLFYFGSTSSTIMQQAIAELQVADNKLDKKLHQLGAAPTIISASKMLCLRKSSFVSVCACYKRNCKRPNG